MSGAVNLHENLRIPECLRVLLAGNQQQERQVQQVQQERQVRQVRQVQQQPQQQPSLIISNTHTTAYEIVPKLYDSSNDDVNSDDDDGFSVTSESEPWMNFSDDEEQ